MGKQKGFKKALQPEDVEELAFKDLTEVCWKKFHRETEILRRTDRFAKLFAAERWKSPTEPVRCDRSPKLWDNILRTNRKEMALAGGESRFAKHAQ